MPMYVIVDWQRRYEVNSKGSAANNGDKLQKYPLRFYRSKVTGTQQGTGYRKLLGIANSNALEVFGIFHKLMEIAADQERINRGKINHSISELAFIIGVDEGKIQRALNVLCDPDLGWLQKAPESPGSSGRFGEIPGSPGSLQNETKTKQNNNNNETNEEKIWFDFLKSYFSPSVRVVALRWFEVVKPLLQLKSKGDVTCLSDISKWLADQVEAGDRTIRIFDMAWQWAVDSQSGRVPMKVLQARLKKEIGYECKSKRGVK